MHIHPYIHTHTNKYKRQPHVPHFLDIFYRKTHLSSLGTCIQPNVNASQAFALQLWHWKLVQQLNCVGSWLPPHHHSVDSTTPGRKSAMRVHDWSSYVHLSLEEWTGKYKFLLTCPNLSHWITSLVHEYTPLRKVQ